jgi:hypothetical protein
MRELTADMAGSIGMGGTRQYLDPSKPNEFPKKRTGDLRAGIIHDIDPQNLVAMWGLAADPKIVYGKYLELGTGRMHSRPWMSLTNVQCRAAIKAIMERPLKALAGTPLAGVSAGTIVSQHFGGAV